MEEMGGKVHLFEQYKLGGRWRIRIQAIPWAGTLRRPDQGLKGKRREKQVEEDGFSYILKTSGHPVYVKSAISALH